MYKPVPSSIRSIRGLFIVVALAALALFLSPLLYSRTLFTMPMLNAGLVYTFVGGLLAAFLVSRGHTLARHVSWTVLPLLLLFFPLGTLVAGMIIVAMRKPEARDYLNGDWEPPVGWKADLSDQRRRRELRSMLLGIPLGLLGAFGAFYATLLVCQLGSEGLAQVGWIFCLLTVPVGIMFGAVVGITLAHIGKPSNLIEKNSDTQGSDSLGEEKS